jgi:cyclophilin family peptidyl-prolyl cis-trans isomerase
VVVRGLSDPDPAVRREAIGLVPTVARGRARALLAPAWTGPDPEDRAAALRAMAEARSLPSSVASLMEPTQPLAFRIAVLPAVTDPSALRDLACGADAPALRTAAAERLLALDPYPLPQAASLLGCRDEAVVQAVAETLEAHPDPSLERPLLDLLARSDRTTDAGFAAVRALDAVYGTGRLPRPGPSVARTLARWLAAPRVREERARLATLLGIPAPPEAHPTLAIPDLADVLRIRGARVWTTEGELRVDLHAADAPYAAWNFARLAEAGSYDGLRFHRVVPDFVAQGGDPREDGWGGPGWVIPDEVDATPYGPGTLGMALSGPDTGGSQWFVALTAQPHLDGDYTAFGHLVEGLDVARRLTSASRVLRITIERG